MPSSETVSARLRGILDEKTDLAVETPASGVILRSAPLERILRALRRAIDTLAEQERARPLGAPPVIARSTIERAGYVEAFPHLLGTVHSYAGDERRWRRLLHELEKGGDWMTDQAPTELVATPAACYHVYPLLAGLTLEDGAAFDVEAFCFRHERSHEPGRLRSFQMRELVRAGEPEEVRGWRDQWVERLRSWLAGLGLEATVEPATDPFFGPAERLMAPSQREEELKWELLVPLSDREAPTAVASCNYHKEHFGEAFRFECAGGYPAHSACVAFGLERLALALVAAHGSDLRAWPPDVTRALDAAG